jgi:hypothetical protein
MIDKLSCRCRLRLRLTSQALWTGVSGQDEVPFRLSACNLLGTSLSGNNSDTAINDRDELGRSAAIGVELRLQQRQNEYHVY